MDKQEEQFIRRINAKEEEGFKELFEKYYRYLVIAARRYVETRDEAEDIVQDAIFNWWQSQKTFNSSINLQQYLYTSVKNGCLHHLKRKHIRQNFTDHILHTTALTEENDSEYEIMYEEIQRRVHQEIDKLPEKCKKIFKEHLAGKKNEEIAELFQISVNTVKNQKKNAMRILRKNLGDTYYLLLLIGIFKADSPTSINNQHSANAQDN